MKKWMKRRMIAVNLLNNTGTDLSSRTISRLYFEQFRSLTEKALEQERERLRAHYNLP